MFDFYGNGAHGKEGRYFIYDHKSNILKRTERKQSKRARNVRDDRRKSGRGY